MPLFWNQPSLSWGLAIGMDHIQLMALHDTKPHPQLCHEFSVPAPNALSLPAHLNNPMAMGKQLAEVLLGCGVRHGRCYCSVPGVCHTQVPSPPQTSETDLEQHIRAALQHSVAEPAQTWAFDYELEGQQCNVAYCPQSLVNDYLILASYMPLEICALEPEDAAIDRAMRGSMALMQAQGDLTESDLLLADAGHESALSSAAYLTALGLALRGCRYVRF